jgi:cardiolipin synthase (CMP-forming)
LRDFRPSIFGKANTFSQIAAVFFVMLYAIRSARWMGIARIVFLRATFAFTIISALHYVFLVQHRLRLHAHALPEHSPAAEQVDAR